MLESVNVKWTTVFGSIGDAEVNLCFGQLAYPMRKPFKQTSIP